MIKAPSRWNSITHRLFANSDVVNHSRRFHGGLFRRRNTRTESLSASGLDDTVTTGYQ